MKKITINIQENLYQLDNIISGVGGMVSYYDSKKKRCVLSLKACWKYGAVCDSCKTIQDYNKKLTLKNKVEYEPGISLEMEKQIQLDTENELKPEIKPKVKPEIKPETKPEIKPHVEKAKQEIQTDMKKQKKGIVNLIKRILHLKK